MDEQYGTDTAENVKLHRLDIRSPNYQHGVFYRATDLPILGEILARLPCRHEDYTFVDLGSGKGLVLLQASAYPFKKVIGVEFARELHEIARSNVNRYPAHLRRCPIELRSFEPFESIEWRCAETGSPHCIPISSSTSGDYPLPHLGCR